MWNSTIYENWILKLFNFFKTRIINNIIWKKKKKKKKNKIK